MERIKVTFENLLAGLLVRFGKANVTDIKVIQDDLFNRFGVLMSPFALDYKGISNHIMKMGDNYYPLEGSKEVLEEINNMVAEIYRTKVVLKPGISDFLKKLQSLGVKMCVATVTDRPIVEDVLKRLKIYEYFSEIFTCAEVACNKETDFGF